MRWKKCDEIKNRAVSMLRRLYIRAEDESLTSSQINKEYTRIRKLLFVKGTPVWVTSFVDGYRSCLDNMMWQKLEFLYVINGVLVNSADKNSDIAAEKFGVTPEEICTKSSHSGFYWKKTRKPFFVGETKNKTELMSIPQTRE